MEDKKFDFPLGKENYKLILIGFGIIVLGFILMMGGGAENATDFSMDIFSFRRITLAHGVPLYLKIGGAEAIRDIKDALELGVDGLVAPMIESSFGLVKFLNACRLIYGNKKIFLIIE